MKPSDQHLMEKLMETNILMFCSQFRPVVGGAERQAEKLALSLAAAGCRVRILTPRIDSDSPDIEEVKGVSIERFPLTDLSRRYPLRGAALLNIPYIIWQVVRAVKQRLKGVDILHCHIASLQTAAAALAGRMAGIPTICKAAMADHRSDLGEIEKAGTSGRLVAWLVRSVVKTWIATTDAVADALIRADVRPDRIVRIPNGVELPTSPNARHLSGGARRFLYLGRLSRNIQRDVPTMIKAFDLLASRHPYVELAIVGGGDLYDETKRQADTCQARGNIHLPGFDQSEKWLAWADCFVLPSRREGLSNALLEAMAAGLPCIANDIPPNREVLDDGDAGILVPVEDCKALEEAMRNMIEKEGLATHYARKARERVGLCYSIEAVASQYLNIYEALLVPEET
jgi:glycosyltransferase involved in cell wall biosynthesis